MCDSLYLLICVLARQRYRVRDEKRRNEDRGIGGGSSTTNGARSNSGSSLGYESKSGTTSWSDNPGNDKNYLGGLGKYARKKEATAAVAAANSMVEQNAGYANAAPYTYNPQTNSVTPAYMPPPAATAIPPTSAPYGQQFAPYQNGTATNYVAAYQQPPAMQYAAPAQPMLPQAPQPQQMYYAPPPPPPPPPGQ